MKTKRFLAFLLATLVLIGLFPLSVGAQDVSVEEMYISGIALTENFNGDWRDHYENGVVVDKWFEYDIYPNDVTVIFSDSSAFSGTVDEVENRTGLSFEYGLQNAQSYENQWKPNNEYVAQASLGNVSCEYYVRVNENPIDHIVVPDVTITENNGGVWYDYYDANGSLKPWYCYDMNNTEMTVYFKDGTSFTGHGYDFYSFVSDTPYFESDSKQDYHNRWLVNNTYEDTVSLLGVKASFNVTIEESYVKSVEVEDLELIENWNGGYGGHADENGDWIENSWFCYNTEPLSLKVTLKDGTVVTGNTSDIYIGTGYVVNSNDNQSYTNQWTVGNTYTATASVCGVTAEYNVTIKESPVESIVVQDCTIIKNCDGYYSGHIDEDGNWVEDSWFRYYLQPTDITVFFKDKTRVSGTVNEIEEATGESAAWTDYQDYSSQYTVGERTETFYFLGASTEYKVNIVETPVESITIADLALKAELDGSLNGHIDEEGNWIEESWFRYNETPESLTVNFKDGTSFTGSPYDLVEEYGYFFDIEDIQSYETEWKAGNTYTLNYNFMGFNGSYKVKIEESPVESIIVEDVYLMEGIDGHWETRYDEDYEPDGEWYCFTWDIPDYTITLTDGTTVTQDDTEYFEQLGFYPTFDNDQSQDNIWLPGNTYTATFSFYGKTVEYNVIIEESPVSSIEASDVTLRAYVDGYWEGGYNEQGDFVDFFCYDNFEPYITVNYSDGTSFSGTCDELFLETNIAADYYADQDPDSFWEPGGSYTATVEFMGAKADFKVIVEEAPIKKVTLKQAPRDTSLVVNEYFDLYGAVFTVEYEDGFKEDVIVPYHHNRFNEARIYSDYFERYSTPLVINESFESTGKYNVSVLIFGYEVKIPVNVTDSFCVSVDLENGEDNALYVTFGYEDGSSSREKIKHLLPSGYGDIIEGGFLSQTYIFTDKGIYIGEIWSYENGEIMLWYEGCVSERITSPWYNIHENTAIGGMMTYIMEHIDNFRGVIDEENIDIICDITWSFSDLNCEYNGDGTVSAVVTELEEKIESLFAVNIDLTEFNGYSNDGYFTYTPSGFGQGSPQLCEFKFADGKWYAVIEQDYGPVFFVFDEDMRLMVYDYELIRYNATVSLKSLPDKLSYAMGEELDTTGMCFVVNSDICYEYETLEYEILGFDSEEPGTKTVRVTLGDEYYDEFEVTVSSADGWVESGDDWRYYEDGVLVTEEWVKSGGKWYYMDAQGVMVTETWKKDSKGWCYLGANGAMATNKWVKDSKGWCYVGKDGYCVTNKWVKDSKGWCYLGKDGRMVTNKWVKASKGWCYVGAKGYALTNCWQKDSKGWCYLDKNGRMVISDWVKDGGKWYYLNSKGYMVTGTVKIDGKTEKFNSKGVWLG